LAPHREIEDGKKTNKFAVVVFSLPDLHHRLLEQDGESMKTMGSKFFNLGFKTVLNFSSFIACAEFDDVIPVMSLVTCFSCQSTPCDR
jgi:hypothetical protein